MWVFLSIRFSILLCVLFMSALGSIFASDGLALEGGAKTSSKLLGTESRTTPLSLALS